MDEATLTIRFKDESAVGPAGVATTSPQYSGSDPGSVKVADQQNAITQAGGVGAMAAKSNQPSGQVPPYVLPATAPQAAPVPNVTVSPAQGGGDPLLKTVQGIVQADPRASAAEIAAALGIGQKQAQSLLGAATVAPGGQQAPQPAPLPSTPPPVAPGPQTAAPPVAPPTATPAVQPPPAPPPVQGQTPPPAPPPIQPWQPAPAQPNADHGVQATVNAIAGLAARGGPLAGALGQAAASAASIPGVSASLGTVAPVLAGAAPYIAAATAAVAIPAVAAYSINSILSSAQRQAAGLSPEISVAEAQASIRQLAADMRTARVLGDEAAQNITNRSRFSAASQGLRDTLAEPFAQRWNDLTNIMAQAAEAADKAAAQNKEDIAAVATALMNSAGDALIPGFTAIQAALATLVDETRKSAAADTSLMIDLEPLPLPPPFTVIAEHPAEVSHGASGAW